MTTLFDLAIETVRLLPPEKQDEIARLMLEMAEESDDVYELSDDEEAEITEALREADRGDLVDAAEARSLLAQFQR